MKLLKSQQQGVWVVRLVGPLVRGQGLHRLRDLIEPLVRRGNRRYVLDMAAVTYADAAGIGELVRADLRVRSRDGCLILAAVPERVRQALAVTGVIGSVTLVDRIGDALVAAGESGLRLAPVRVGQQVGEVRRSPGIMRRIAEGSCRSTPIPG